MKIKKIGHCCLRIEELEAVILTDPGVFSTAQNEETGIDAILITHEHADHFHIESLKKILENNPTVQIIANKAVKTLLDKENIACTEIKDGEVLEIKGVKVESFSTNHAEIYPSILPVWNSGFLIGEKLYLPGDALHNPVKKIEILAAPVVGPWLNIKQAVDYIKEISPCIAFPIHDGFLKVPGPFHSVPKMLLENSGIEFVVFEEGKEYEVESKSN